MMKQDATEVMTMAGIVDESTGPLITSDTAPPNGRSTVCWIEMYDGRPAHGQRVLLAAEDGRVFFGHRGDAGCYFDDRNLLIESRPIRWWALEPLSPQNKARR